MAARDDLAAKRDASIDALLSSMASDPGAGAGLVAYGRDLVLPRLHTKLTAMQTTTSPADDIQDRLVELAKELASEWPGYEPGCPPEERTRALEALKAYCGPSSSGPSAPPSTAPATSSS